MTAALGLAKESAGKKFAVGDIVLLEALIDEKIGSPGDEWRFVNGDGWIVVGDAVVDTRSLEPVASDGVFTKLRFRAVLYKSGDVTLGKLTIEHVPSKRTFELSGKVLEHAEKVALSQEEQQESWLLPTIPVREFNYFMIALAILLAGCALFALVYALIQYWKKRENAKVMSPDEIALDSLKKLESLAKNSAKSKDWKKFSYQLADTLKRYADSKLNIDSRDLTDREFLELLPAEMGGGEFSSFLEPVLSELNEARYGTKPLDIAHAKALLSSAKDFILKIKARTAEAKK